MCRRRLPARIGELRVTHSLKTWGAVHVATTILTGVDRLIVRDHGVPAGEYEGIFVSGPFDIDEDRL